MPTVVLKLHPSQPFELDADCSKLLPASHRVLWVGQFQQCVAGPGHLIGKFMTPLSARDITTRETIFLAIPVDISIRVPSRQTQPSEGVMLLESALPSRCSAPKAPKHVCSPSCLRHGDVKLPRFHFLIGHGMVRVELPAQIPLRACPTTHKQTAWSAAGGCNSSLQDNMPGRENNRKAPAIRRPSLPDGEFTVPSHTEVWFFVPDHIEEFREDWERKWMYASKQTLASASSSPVMPSQAGGGASSRREGVNSLLPSGLPLPDSEIPRVYLLHQRAVMASARLYDGRWSRHIRQVIQKVVEINRTRHHVLGDEQAPSTPRSVSDAECAFIEKEFERMAKEDTESSSVRWRNFQFQRFVSGETLPDHRLGLVPCTSSLLIFCPFNFECKSVTFVVLPGPCTRWNCRLTHDRHMLSRLTTKPVTSNTFRTQLYQQVRFEISLPLCPGRLKPLVSQVRFRHYSFHLNCVNGHVHQSTALGFGRKMGTPFCLYREVRSIGSPSHARSAEYLRVASMPRNCVPAGCDWKI